MRAFIKVDYRARLRVLGSLQVPVRLYGCEYVTSYTAVIVGKPNA